MFALINITPKTYILIVFFRERSTLCALSTVATCIGLVRYDGYRDTIASFMPAGSNPPRQAPSIALLS